MAEGKYDVSDNTLIIDLKEGLCLKYIYYVLINQNLNQYSRGGGQPLITAGDLKKLLIPIPEKSVQRSIAQTIDKLYEICMDTTNGLPAEIGIRQTQYQYYKEKLLTFREA